MAKVFTAGYPGLGPGMNGTPAWGRGRDRTVKVLPQQARDHNRTLVLTTLIAHKLLSRADIARQTGLTRVTVSDLVAELVDRGLVVERGQRSEARPGKPATILEIDKDACHIVGVDLSDLTQFRSAVFDLEGTMLSEHVIDTGSVTGDAAASLAVEAARIATAAATAPVLGIGIGTPGVVDASGRVLNAPNLAWRGLGLRDLMNQTLAPPVHVANDANAAVMAEHSFSGGYEDLLLITIGTGVGSGLLLDGVPRVGRRFAAGEIGHVVVGTDGGPACACGKAACLESWLSVPNLRERLAAATDAAERDAILAEAGRRLGIAIAPVIGTLNITDIAVSGPPDLLDGPLLEATMVTLRERMLAEATRELQVRLVPHSADIVLRGSAALVMAAELGVG